MPDASYERLSATSLRVTEELVLPAGAILYRGEKAADKAELHSITVALAASATTDGMAITITCLDAAGNVIKRVQRLDIWISESAIGAGLTADSYSGTVTASTGTILTAHTAKKHFSVLTAATGIAVLVAVDSANPVDQYVAAATPDGRVYVSAISGTNWEGAV